MDRATRSKRHRGGSKSRIPSSWFLRGALFTVLAALVLAAVGSVAMTPAATTGSIPRGAPVRWAPEVAPTIAVSPLQGPIGALFNVSGSGFTASSGANVSFQGYQILTGTNLTPSAAGCSVGSYNPSKGLPFTTDPSGAFQCSFLVPAPPVGATGIAQVVGWDASTLQSSQSVHFNVTTPSISVTPRQGPVGLSVKVTGSGFSVSVGLASLVFDSVSITSCSSGSLNANSSGDFSCQFPVPSSGTSGTVVSAMDVGGQTATTAFVVTAPTIVVTPVQGNIASSFTVNASGFTPNGEATVSFNGGIQGPYAICSPGNYVGSTIDANSTGAFTCPFKVPTEPPGSYPVYARDETTGDASNTVSFTVNPPVISVIPAQGPVGADVKVVGSGFIPDDPLVSLVFDGVTVSSCTSGSMTASGTGALSCAFSVPSGTSSTTVVATEAGGRTATATFVVTVPGISVTPTQGPVGNVFSVTGSGFTVASGASFAFNGVDLVPTACSVGTSSLTTITTNSTGEFICTFSVPSENPGQYSIVGTDLFTTTQTTTLSFDVTALSVSVTPGRGPVGTLVTVTGSGYSVSMPLLSLDFDNVPITSCPVGSLTTSATGAFLCKFPVPAGTFGTIVVATDIGGSTASATYVVTGLSISVGPGHGPTGTKFAVTGTGFSIQSPVNVSFAGSDLVPTDCSVGSFASTVITTNGTGDFACDFVVPAGLPGVYPIVSGDVATSNDSNSVAFTIPTPAVSLTPGSGTVGSTVTFSGANFTLNSEANVTFGGGRVTPTSCSAGTPTGSEIALNSSGAFDCSYAVPTLPAGLHAFAATSGKQQFDALFSIVPHIAVSPAGGKVGATVAVGGDGFDAFAAYSVAWNSSTAVCSGSTNSSGQFNCTFAVPPTAAGPNTLTVSEGGFSGAQALTFSFTVAASPPPPSSGSPFPWWEVGVAAAVVVLVLVSALYIYGRSRRSHPGGYRGRPSSGVQPYVGPSGTAGVSTSSVEPGPSVGGATTGAAAALEPEPDIDELIARLERMSVQMFKKTPKELAAQSSTDEIAESAEQP